MEAPRETQECYHARVGSDSWRTELVLGSPFGAMDFIHDYLADGTAMRVLSFDDCYTRES